MNFPRSAAALAAVAVLGGALRAQISATFDPLTGVLKVAGTSHADEIMLGSDARGFILVNGGSVRPAGGVPTRRNTSTIEVHAGDGDDKLDVDEPFGPLPRCRLFGEGGDDVILGSSSDDEIIGGTGDDLLIGGAGNDDVDGVDGNDLVIWNDNHGNDSIEGGEGFDLVQVNGSSSAGDAILIEPAGPRVRVRRTSLDLFTLNIGTTEDLDVNGLGGDDVVTATPGLAGRIALRLDGGWGNDLIMGGDGVDYVRGGAGNDVLIGGSGNDVILGQDGSDLLIWNDGDGSDFMEGGEGFDIVQVNGANDAGDHFAIEANQGRLRIQRNNLGLFTLDIGTTESLDVNGQGGSDVIIASVGLRGVIGLDLDGGEGNDLLIGGDGDELIRGGEGSDTIRGGGGNDVIFGDDGDDDLYGDHGDDAIDGGEGKDFADGGAGIDVATRCERLVNFP